MKPDIFVAFEKVKKSFLSIETWKQYATCRQLFSNFRKMFLENKHYDACTSELWCISETVTEKLMNHE